MPVRVILNTREPVMPETTYARNGRNPGVDRARAKADDFAMNKPVRIPGPDHPITVTPAAKHIVVKFAERTLADTHNALTLREASYPAVQYIPRTDADMSQLQRTDHRTYCPYKGDCSYYSIPALGERGVNAVWTYESPHEAVASIKDHLAFYSDRVTIAER
jgi:uncharacterized protein (DUF427 family)